MTFRPGEIGTKTSFGSGVWLLKNSASPPSTVATNANAVAIENRPSYARSPITHIGSTTWRYPTGYSHYSRVVKAPGSSLFRWGSTGQYFTSESNPDLNSKITTQWGYPFNDLSGIEYSNARNGAKVKALNSISQNLAGVGEDLITYIQTVRMFASKASLLHAILNSAKRNPLLKGLLSKSSAEVLRTGTKAAAEAYLEYVYGWKPLVSDVYGIYQLLKNYAAGLKPIIVHGHGKFDIGNQAYMTKFATASLGWFGDATMIEKGRATCDLYARVNPDLIAFRALNQLGLFNPAAIAWEVTPWSFVVDWFVPIGPVLSALTAPLGLNFVSGSVATRNSRTFQGNYHVGSTLALPLVEDKPLTYTVIDEMYKRDQLLTWPTPVPYLDLDPFRGDRWIKALALLIVNLRR